MNEIQNAIFHLINNILSDDFFDAKLKNHKEQKIIENSAIRYGLINYVAKYSLANNEYLVTDKCLNYLQSQSLISEKGLLRGKKGNKHKFTFEHPIPANIITDLLYKNRKDKKMMLKVLKATDLVTVLTYEENDEINKSRLTSSMPNDWEIFQDNPFIRYSISGVESPTKTIKVYGALAR